MVSEKVISIIAATKRIPADRIALESSFEELEIESLDAIEIVYCLEEEYGISIPDEAVKGLRTVGDAVESVEKLLSEKAAEPGKAVPG